MVINLYGDGSNSTSRKDSDGGAGVVILFKKDNVERIVHIGKYLQHATNNIAEIEAINTGLDWLIKGNCQDIKIVAFSDSQYCCGVLNRLVGENNWEYHAKKNVDLIQKTRNKILIFSNFSIKWVRGHSNHIYNDTAHYLANKARVEKKNYYEERTI